MKYFWGFLSAILVFAGALTLRPDLIPGFDNIALSTPMAHLIAVRPWLFIAFMAIALFFLIFSLVRYTLVGAGRVALATGLIYLTMSVFHGGTMYSRGLENPDQLGPDRGVTSAGVGNGSITVLTYNTLGGSIDEDTLADSIQRNGVDVVVLTETSTARGTEMAGRLAALGLQFQQFDTGTDEYATEFESTVVLVSGAMGEYVQISSAQELPSTVTAVPASGNGPKIVAVHPFAPTLEGIDRWRSDIDSIYAQCSDSGPFILAGDFNSTVDHQMIVGGDCQDGAIEAGSGGLGTWPTRIPSLLGTPIDRVLHDGSYEGVDAMLFESGHSDHRGLIVRLMPSN
ncbi:MAG: hypothetical protein GX037_08145 [Trueperella sp.]|nr:hypothetical protein [Trueperella sp.]